MRVTNALVCVPRVFDMEYKEVLEEMEKASVGLHQTLTALPRGWSNTLRAHILVN